MSAFTQNVTDCLVLKLEEVDSESKEIDTTLYILYDKINYRYLIRGRRKWTPTFQSCTYSFECKYAHDLAEFIQYVISPDNEVNEVLYNYDNFPNNSNHITYEFLHDYDHSDYEISGYNRNNLIRKRIIKLLRILKNIFNYY